MLWNVLIVKRSQWVYKNDAKKGNPSKFQMFDELSILSILGSQNLLFETFCEVHKSHGYSFNKHH